MAKQTINIGAIPDDGTGDSLRAGMNKINLNFTELYGLHPQSHANLTNLELAQTGVTMGHIDDQAQTIAGIKTFSDKIGIDGATNLTHGLNIATSLKIGNTTNGAVTLTSNASNTGLITANNLSPADPNLTSTMSEGANFGFNGAASNFYGMGLGAVRDSAYDIWFTTGATNGGGFRFYNKSIEVVTINKAGNVGIGTSSPNAELEVSGEARLSKTSDMGSNDASLATKKYVDDNSGSVVIGNNWVSRTSAADNYWYGIAYGNGLFVAVAYSGTGNRVMTSPDGINWTTRTPAADRNWFDITYGNGLFVAVASSGTGDRVMTSPDGITWTIRTSAADNNWDSVTYGNGLFVAVAHSGTGNRVMTSPDGITWTIRTSAADNTWNSITYGNGLFIAVASSGTGNRVMTSPDGIHWTSKTSAVDNDWISVVYGNGLFVVVAYSGTGNRVMTSGKQLVNVQQTDVIQGKKVFNGPLETNGTLLIDASHVDFTNIPTTDPLIAGRLYKNSVFLCISNG